MNRYRIFVMYIGIMLTLGSCLQNNTGKQLKMNNYTGDTITSPVDSVFKNENITITFSTSIDKLGLLLDFTTYKPTKVKFKYTSYDNSGNNSRIPIPGPSDYSLEALLYFDSATFRGITDSITKSHIDSAISKKEVLMFNWMDEVVRNELKYSNHKQYGRPNFLFRYIHGDIWSLNNKILIAKWTN